MHLVVVCTPCEGEDAVEWTYNGVTLNETTAQLTLPPDEVMMSASGYYKCSCQGSNGEAAFAVEMSSAGVFNQPYAGLVHNNKHTATNTLTSTITSHVT